MVDSANVEDCHWIKTSNGSKKVIIKLSKQKDAAKIRSSKKVKGDEPLLSWNQGQSLFTLMTTFVNTTNFFGKNVRAYSQTNLFTPFGLLMVLCG